MKAVKPLFVIAAIAALLSVSLAAPADARDRRHGHGHGHGHGHYPSYPRRGYYGPRYRAPRYRGPRISVGFGVPVLPFGYVDMVVGGNPYYYQGGHFYRPAPTGYAVVSAPLGAAVLTLPASAVRVQIGGFSYYQYADAYYQWQPRSNRYVVVPPPAGTAVAAAPVAVSSAAAFNPGQVIETLPSGYAAEVINGVQYYRYGGHYFMPTQRDGREVYVVVQI